jgi:hypothetical protein
MTNENIIEKKTRIKKDITKKKTKKMPKDRNEDKTIVKK